jgi:hypothetical protein
MQNEYTCVPSNSFKEGGLLGEESKEEGSQR